MLQRRARLRSYTPMTRGKPMRRNPASPSKKKQPKRHMPPEYINDAYLEWLRHQPGVYPGGTTPAPSVPHHARHDANGASLGRNIKDDRRAIPLSRGNHGHIHKLTSGPFKGWTRAQVHAWVDGQIAEHRARYLATQEAWTKTVPGDQ